MGNKNQKSQKKPFHFFIPNFVLGKFPKNPFFRPGTNYTLGEKTLPPNFFNLKLAFSDYSNAGLKRAKLIYAIIKFPWMVGVLTKLVRAAIFLRLPLKPILRPTVFAQFCAGENIIESNRIVRQLGKSGICSILDYSAEGKEIERHFRVVEEEVIKVISLASKDIRIPYTSLKFTGIFSKAILEKIGTNQSLTVKFYNFFVLIIFTE